MAFDTSSSTLPLPKLNHLNIPDDDDEEEEEEKEMEEIDSFFFVFAIARAASASVTAPSSSICLLSFVDGFPSRFSFMATTAPLLRPPVTDLFAPLSLLLVSARPEDLAKKRSKLMDKVPKIFCLSVT